MPVRVVFSAEDTDRHGGTTGGILPSTGEDRGRDAHATGVGNDPGLLEYTLIQATIIQYKRSPGHRERAGRGEHREMDPLDPLPLPGRPPAFRVFVCGGE